MITPTTQDIAGNFCQIYNAMALADVGEPAINSGSGDKTVQAAGTFGAGGAVVIEGTLDDPNGLSPNWFPLHDPQGVALSFTAGGIKAILEHCVATRPRVTGGDGTTAITVSINVRR